MNRLMIVAYFWLILSCVANGCKLGCELRGFTAPPKLRISLTENITPNDMAENFMKESIMWYKNTLSPIMPPRCRFLPSCSTYGLQSIDKYGPWKGGVLTAWRIFRCNPTGGSGYDPPVWPPPGYFAGSTTKTPF